MKSQILKVITLIVLLMAGCFACTDENNTDDYNMVSIEIKCAFSGVVDPNIVSFSLPGIVEAVCFKDPPIDGGFPEELNHDLHATWTIHLTMAEGTDRSKLAPIITLTPGATITPESGNVFDFSNHIEFTLTAPDGSKVKYYLVSVIVIADADDDNMVPIKIQCSLTGAIDPNIVSFALPGIVNEVCFEFPSYPGYGGTDGWSPHRWSIYLFMAKETDRTKFAPIITLAPSAAITLVRSAVHGFHRIFEWELIAPDGSTVNYAVTVFFIGDPVSFIIVDDDGNQTVELVYPDDPRYPY